MKAINFHEEFPALQINIFQKHHVFVFDLTSVQDSEENLHYPELSR